MLRLCEQQRGVLLTLFAVLFLLCPAAAQTTDGPSVSADSLWHHLLVLGDDSLQGRGTGSDGCAAAARYIAGNLSRFGLQPVPGMTDLSQRFPVHGSVAEERTNLTFYAPKDSYHPRLNEDYSLYSAGDQTFLPVPIRMIFVGFGIVAPEYDYNDYQNIDVRNAIVVFLSGEPPSVDRQFFDGEQETFHSSVTEKQRTALARGARGSILIAGPDDRSMEDWYEQQRHFRFEEVRLVMSPSENLNIILNPKLVPFLFTGTSYTYEQIIEQARRRTLRSFLMEMRLSFQGQFRQRDFIAENIVAMVPGTDPALRDSFVIISAHYDHLGVGVPVDEDSIYNGVADNASGTAALLELARAFVLHPARRTVIFVFLTGEERGFLGSRFYCLNPPVPLSRTIADINIDGLSLFEPVRSVIGIGEEYSTLGIQLERSMTEAGIGVDRLPPDLFRSGQFRNSDQFIFAQAGIPSILVAEGLQYTRTPYDEGLRRFVRWTEERYHTPFDDLRQTLDRSAAVQHTILLERFARDVANHPSAPQWYNGTPFLAERLRTISEGR